MGLNQAGGDTYPPGTVGVYADNIFWSIGQAGELGVDCDMLNEAIDWAERAWPLIDFAQKRSRFTAYVQLAQDERGMTAIIGNEGASPRLEWFVGGVATAASGLTLPAGSYAPGDEVRVRLASNATCVPAGRRSAEATRLAE